MNDMKEIVQILKSIWNILHTYYIIEKRLSFLKKKHFNIYTCMQYLTLH